MIAKGQNLLNVAEGWKSNAMNEKKTQELQKIIESMKNLSSKNQTL